MDYRENRLNLVNLGEKRIYELQSMYELYFAKLVQVGDDSAYLLGGQSVPQLTKTAIIKRTVYHVKRDDQGDWQVERDSLMQRQRICFGACKYNDSSIIVVGGKGYSENSMKDTEFWSGGESKWQAGPPLNTGRRNPSVIVTDGTIIVVGGAEGD